MAKRDNPRERLRYRALMSLVETGSILRKTADSFFRRYELTQSQFNLLMVLKYQVPNGCSQAEICRRLLVKGANMTGLVRRLEASGLVVREPDPDDERVWQVSLTFAGRKLLGQVEPDYYAKVEQLLAVHTRKDLQSFLGLLESTREAVLQLN